MSHPSRPRERGTAPRRSRVIRLEAPQALEDRRLLAPVVAISPLAATFTAAAAPTNANLGTITINQSTTAANFPSAAPLTSVTELSPASQFGGDIVRVVAGPGGVFGNGLYAISRGAGENTGAVNRPGVIYRVDPTTGKASVFFDLNTVISQLEPGSTAANSAGAQTGLVNWYDIAFDPEGYFDGLPSMFVSSVDASDPTKNIIFRIAPDGSFMGAFADFALTGSNLKFAITPSAILVPPPQDQTFLRGLLSGAPQSTSATSTFNALFFNANEYTPGQVINSKTLPTGVTTTDMNLGPIVGMAASNQDYFSRVYDAFTDFGTPAAGGVPGVPGDSGVQGLNGDLLFQPPAAAAGVTTTATAVPLDQQPLATTNFRRLQDIGFDQYGYFEQGVILPAGTTSANIATTLQANVATINPPVNAGALFVSDLASGLEVTITPLAPLPTTPIVVPVQQSGTIGVTTDANGNVVPVFTPFTTAPITTPEVINGVTTIPDAGGRIVRILPNGTVNVFATGFDTSTSTGPTSFVNSQLSVSFSADGTTMYASDDQGIWQFKTVASLASSSTGSLIGLNDLRALGVPYDGQGAAVAVIDSGVDANSTPFRGRVAQGTNVITNGNGNVDTAPGTGTTTTTTTTTTGAAGTGGNSSLPITVDGHGTLIAGVVAQFVPQATIEPVDIFNPFQLFTAPATGTGGTTTGGTTTGTGATVTANSNATTTSNAVYQGLNYTYKHPFVNDPVRPNRVDRVIAAAIGFGSTETFTTEGVAFRRYSQLVIAFKNQLDKFLKAGIAPIAAAGQFGSPFASGISSATGTTGATTTTTGTGAGGATNNQQNANVGDVNGMALPAVLNEVISVTGSYSWPYTEGPTTFPVDTGAGTVPPMVNPFLVAIGANGLGNGQTRGTGTTATTGVNATSNGITPNDLIPLTAGDSALFADEILGSANRGTTTDYTAPALNIPTFRRTFTLLNTTGTTGTATTDPSDHNAFQDGGTSLSAGVLAGAYALVSSALGYWAGINASGVTSDAYLTTPVGVRTLNFGVNALKDLSAYNTPSGINAILAYTAIPATDANLGLSQAAPPYLLNSNHFRDFARVDVGNAIASIEGTIAIQYLLDHNVFPIINTTHDGIITAQQLQNFENNATAMGMPEAGAMARLLGGTATLPGGPGVTGYGETTDNPNVLQNRFNYFDYAADGQLNGSITISQLKQLAHTLLPPPTSYKITNRQQASLNPFLLAPNAHRNFQDLQHIKLNYAVVPARLYQKYKGISPDRFGVNRLGQGVVVTSQFPVYELFTGSNGQTITNLPAGNTKTNTTMTTTTTTTTTTSSSGSATTPAASAATTGGTTASSGSSASAPTTSAATTSGTTASSDGATTPTASAATTSGTTASSSTPASSATDTSSTSTAGSTTTPSGTGSTASPMISITPAATTTLGSPVTAGSTAPTITINTAGTGAVGTDSTSSSGTSTASTATSGTNASTSSTSSTGTTSPAVTTTANVPQGPLNPTKTATSS
jgi:hypothetical protein